MKIRVLPEAVQDLLDGISFYERQGSGLGDYFRDSLFSDIESLHLFAGIHAKFEEKYYRLLARRFPFAVYYLLEEGQIQIVAILDCRRNPDTAITRLK